ncbi:MAG: dockerin type I repeat-containing protein [candidate division Zixibacteria bacterium]|nr:dockerin type I repeat-containing protein [candidate division Zixibacteria bacterium]MCI0597445.1 dockerin type I repeat-containing protein [candidate division Zixibacteria bacterium]
MALRCKRFRGDSGSLPKVPALVIIIIGGFLAAFPFSSSLAQGCFIRGDFDGNGVVDATDLDSLLTYIFLGAPVPFCEDAADINDDGSSTPADWTILNAFLNTGGAPPPPPFPGCGLDPTPDGFTCFNTRGDVNNSGGYTPADAVLELNCVFIGSPCNCSSDVTCDGALTPADVVSELLWVFLGAPLPPCPCP